MEKPIQSHFSTRTSEISGKNIQKFKDNTLELHLPYFNEEIIIDRKESFEKLMKILDNNDSDNVKAQLLEEIPFEHWLNVLGQRLTSASIRDENAIPPLKGTLINACKEPFNNEITIAQKTGKSILEEWMMISGER